MARSYLLALLEAKARQNGQVDEGTSSHTVGTGSSLMDVASIAAILAPQGLNLCAAARTEDVPAAVWLSPGRPSTIEPGSTLLLVGHGGLDLWANLHGGGAGVDFATTPDPIDTFSAQVTEAALAEVLPHIGRRLLYPHPECPVDLVALGRHVGWHTPSPIGLGIHARYGLWTAFRALWALDATIDNVGGTPDVAPEVCAACVTQDCVGACPADAVTVGRRFGLTACFDHRARPDSSCADTCHARRACPVGAEHRYITEQMAYHYRISRPPVVGGGFPSERST